jgi:hypothetical protein
VDCQRFRSVAELGRDLCEVVRGSL